MPPDKVPRSGTFWVALPGPNGGTIPPYPCPPLDPNLPVYSLANGIFLVDGTVGSQATLNMPQTGRLAGNNTSLAALEAQATAVVNVITRVQTTVAGAQIQTTAGSRVSMDLPAFGGGSDGTSGFYSDSFNYILPTNGLWLTLTNVSNGIAYLNLHGATDAVYEVWSKTNLSDASWNIEQELWPTDTNSMPFTIPVLDRTDSLFVWARDWTGVTSGGNRTPEWWFWKYYGTVNLSDSSLDANGNTLLNDYTNNMAPNNVGQAPFSPSTISVPDPVDLKWDGKSLYVLSGSTATITEFDTSGNVVRSLTGIGTSPSGLDVDAAGNVYVAMNGDNQVWKFNPTNTTFAADATFGNGGYIGNGDDSSGSDPGTFNAPFDVAVSPDGGTISVSDSGNNYIQQFDSSGNFLASFGSSGSDVGQFNAPEGLTYDSVGNLYIADSGNNRIVLAQGSEIEGVSGTSGTAFGQFNTPANVNVNNRGIYVADTANNRIQCFNPLANGVYGFTTSDIRFVLSTSFNQPAAVAAVDSLTNEMFYVADTGNNRVLLYGFPSDDPTLAWNSMTNRITAGDIPGAISSFCSDTADSYKQAFSFIGINNVIAAINEIGALTPVYINNDQAEYYFTNMIDGHVITFPVEFVKENGVWKILEF